MKKSGFRYYTMDNLALIRSIRSLQNLGLSLKEVAEYYYDTENMDHHLQRLLGLRAELDRSIQMLRVRSVKRGSLTVHSTILPRQVCLCRHYSCKDRAEFTSRLRNTCQRQCDFVVFRRTDNVEKWRVNMYSL